MAEMIEFVGNVGAAITMPPNEHLLVGWVTALNGFGLSAGTIKNDLTVTNPLTGTRTPVVGVLGRFLWNGGTADPLQLQFYVSQENYVQLRTLTELGLKDRAVSALNFSVVNFYPETAAWYTAFAPLQQLSGILVPATNPVLDVSTTPVSAAGLSVYEVQAEIGPSGNGVYDLKLETSPTTASVHAWGVLASPPAV